MALSFSLIFQVNPVLRSTGIWSFGVAHGTTPNLEWKNNIQSKSNIPHVPK
jgi:hypothetical protein